MAKDKRRKAAAALARIYGRIPDAGCKGLCHESCGPIGMSFAESRAIEEHTGRALPMYDTERSCCPFLTQANRCSIYEHRPVICRLYGVTPGLPCPHGCRPAWMLSDMEAAGVLASAACIAGERPVRIQPPGFDARLGRIRAINDMIDRCFDPPLAVALKQEVFR